MTKNRLFTFLILSLIGGFVLSAPDSALAETKEEAKANETVNAEIQKFINSKMIIKDTQKTASQTSQSLQDEINKTLVPNFNKTLGDIEEKYKCDCDSLTNSATREALGKEYSWMWHVDECLATCKKEVPDNEKEEIYELAKQIEDKRAEYRFIDKQDNVDAKVYIWCPKAEETSCTVTEEEADRKITFEQKCCVPFMVNEEDNTLTSITGTSRGCVPLPFKLYEERSCLFCNLFGTIFKTIQNASTTAFNKFSKPLSTLVLIGLSIWIAFMVLTNVSSLTKQDAPKFLNDLFKASFKVIIAFFLLRYSSIIYNIIIGPLLKAGFEFGISFLQFSDHSSLASCSANKNLIGATGGVLPSYVYANLLCFIKAVQYELGTSQAIGSSLMCISMHSSLGNVSAIAKIMPDFTMMLQGVIIYIISFILSIAFAFYLIDATVSLGIFGVLLPFLLLCWPFKVTNGYFTKGVSVFMNSWFVFVFMGIVTNITLQLIGQSLTGGKGGFKSIIDAINSNHVKTLQSLLDIGFSGFLILLASCVFAIKLMQKVESLASQFAGGSGLGIGSKIGGLAAGAATTITKTGVGMVTGAAKSAYNAQIWEEKDADGNYTGKFSSAHDKVRTVKTNVARKVTGKMQRGADKLGDGLGRIVHAVGSMRGRKRRNPSA